MADDGLSCQQLRLWARRFDENRERFEALVAELTDEQAVWQPAAGRWSVSECIDHLNVTGDGYQPRMADAIAHGRRRGLTGSAPYRGWTIAGRLILYILEPQKRHKAKAPGVFQPAPGSALELAQLREGFLAVHKRWGQLLADADGLSLGRIVFASPAARFLRITLAEAFRIQVLHEERHLRQAERVVASAGFPD